MCSTVVAIISVATFASFIDPNVITDAKNLRPPGLSVATLGRIANR